MKRLFTLFVVALLMSSSVLGQRVCGSQEYNEQQMLANPAFQSRQIEIEQFTNQFVSQFDPNAARDVITIPVVFHIVHNTTAQNISDATILAQLEQLNRDFSRTNSDWTSTPSVFQPFVANTEIQFCLASVDPTGAPTSGIIRRSTTTTSFSTNNNVKFTSSGGSNAWPAGQYLNFWVCNLSGGTLGYAQFPGGSASTDGVVCQWTSVGSVSSPGPSSGAPYNRGRTGTHEVGHWLNLRHIWGDASCGNDQVTDTPTQQTANYGCPSFPRVSCSNGPNGAMFMNYMDYTDDVCMYMFTTGQSARMNALFAAGGARSSILTSSGCAAPVACGVPTGLTSSGITNTTATVNWSAVSGAVRYLVDRKVSSSSVWVTIDSTTTNSYAMSSLVAGTSYDVRIRARCSAGTSANSTTLTFSTTGSCGTPSGLASSAISSSGATITWSAVSGATSYNVRYRVSTATASVVVTSTTNSRVLSGLAASTNYVVDVQAICSGGTSAYSSTINFTTTATACADSYEANNSSTAAALIPTNSNLSSRISSSTDRDWYRFSNSTTNRNIRIELFNLPADYDVRLYNPSGTQVAISENGSTTSEVINYNNGPTGTYRIQIYGYNGAFNSSLCYSFRASIGSVAFREGANMDAEEIELIAEPFVSTEPLSLINAFPNPTSDVLNVLFHSESDGMVMVTLLDIAGRVVHQYNVNGIAGNNKTDVDMTAFAPGYYTIMVGNGTSKATLQVIKQ
jgi:hypothetical protein